MQTLFNFLLRLILLAAGLLFAASVLVVVALGATLWALRAGWSRLTGRPVAPLVFRMNPGAGFRQVYRGWPGPASGPGRSATAAAQARPQQRELGDVTDVDVKPPRV